MHYASKRTICIVLLFAVMLVCAGCSNSNDEEAGKTIHLIIGSGHPTGAMIYTTVMQDFFVPEVTRRVEEETDYTISWVEAYGGSIAGLAEMLEAIEAGRVDIGGICLSVEFAKLALQNLTMNVPFTTPDSVQQLRVVRQLCEKHPFLTEMFETDYNQKFLGWGIAGGYNLITNFPITKVEDMEGKKIAHGGPSLPFVANTGAIGVQSELPEAYTCLETGIHDGWIMFPGSIYGYKLHEVAPYYTVFDFGAPIVSSLSANLDTWKDLPSEIQDIIIEVSKEYEVVCAEEVAELDLRCIDKMVEEGTTVSSLPEDEIKRWASIIPDLPYEKAEQLNALGLPASEVFQTYFDLLEQDGFEMPRVYSLP